MRAKIMLALSVLVVAALSYAVYEKEQIKKSGRILLLELSPLDPRSLIQGDYMRLRYALEDQVPAEELPSRQKRGYLVVRPDENNRARFVRLHTEGQSLAAAERRLKFRRHGRFIRIVPDSFFFQEGHAKYYQQARYGLFQFSDTGVYLLVGLADENGDIITAP